jgi:hypothetical protein
VGGGGRERERERERRGGAGERERARACMRAIIHYTCGDCVSFNGRDVQDGDSQVSRCLAVDTLEACAKLLN